MKIVDADLYGFAIEQESDDTRLVGASDIDTFGFTAQGTAGGQLDRTGFTHTDIDTLSGRLIDAFVTWGHPAGVAATARNEHAAKTDRIQLAVLHCSDVPAATDAVHSLAALQFEGTS